MSPKYRKVRLSWGTAMHTSENLAAPPPSRTRPPSHRLASIVVDDRTIAYKDVGSGPPVILAHCSGASHRVWTPLVAALRDHYRVLAPDLLGYGKSERWPVNAPLNSWTDLNVLLALADIAGGPVHIVGHSYGGAVALEAARVLGARVKSLTLIEPVAIHLLKLTGRLREYEEIAGVGQRMLEALKLRQDRKAAGIYVKYWDGRLTWWLMTSRLRQRVVETVGKVGAEFDAASRLSRTVGDYRGIVAPTRLIAGGRTRGPARAIVDELLQILHAAHLNILPDAGHMSPISHASATTGLIARHIDATEFPAAANDVGWSRAELSTVVKEVMRGRRATARIESLP